MTQKTSYPAGPHNACETFSAMRRRSRTSSKNGTSKDTKYCACTKSVLNLYFTDLPFLILLFFGAFLHLYFSALSCSFLYFSVSLPSGFFLFWVLLTVVFLFLLFPFPFILWCFIGYMLSTYLSSSYHHIIHLQTCIDVSLYCTVTTSNTCHPPKTWGTLPKHLPSTTPHSRDLAARHKGYHTVPAGQSPQGPSVGYPPGKLT